MVVTWSALVVAAAAVRPWRDAVLLGTVGWGLTVWGITELQSLGGFLDVPGVVGSWAGLAIASGLLAGLAWWIGWSRAHRGVDWSPAADPSRGEWLPWLTLMGIVFLLGATALSAWHAPPRPYDAEAYHVPRVLYWVQYASVEFFPTANDRHLFMSPWPAYCQLQMYLLAGSDRVSNFVQWIALLLMLPAVAAVAGALGAGRKAQVLAAGIAAALPIVVLSAPATQTDLTAALWLMIFAAYAFRHLPDDRPEPWLDVAAAGAAIGLACLSKGTVFPLGAALVLAYAGFRLTRLRPRPVARLGRLAAAGLIAAALLTPHTARMMLTFGHPTTPAFHQDFVMNGSYHPSYLVSNLVRHALVHLGTWDEAHAQPLYRFNAAVHEAIGVTDGDYANSHRSQSLVIHSLARFTEEHTGNALHLLLYGIAGAALVLGRRSCRTPRLLAFAGCLLLGYVLFCWQIKYQWWLSRLQLPMWAVAAPWAAAILERWWHRWALSLVTVALLLAAVPMVLGSYHRPLWGPGSVLRADYDRLEQAKRSWGYGHYRNIVPKLPQDARVIGYITDGDTVEYNLWIALRERFEQMPRIENLVPDDGAPAPMGLATRLTDPPRFIIGISYRVRMPWRMTALGATYRQVARSGRARLYERQEPPASPDPAQTRGPSTRAAEPDAWPLRHLPILSDQRSASCAIARSTEVMGV
jgi:hypothetical protein